MWDRKEPDWSFLDALRRNDGAAWERFFAEHRALIESVVSWSKWRFEYHVREDVAQGIRAELVKAMASFDGKSSLEYFIKRVCFHRCVDEVRRQVRHGKVFVALTDENPDAVLESIPHEDAGPFRPVDAIIRHERAGALQKLIAQLEATCSDAIRMFYLEELSYKDMAARLGVKIDTIGARLSKCLNKLRDMARRQPVFGEE